MESRDFPFKDMILKVNKALVDIFLEYFVFLVVNNSALVSLFNELIIVMNAYCVTCL